MIKIESFKSKYLLIIYVIILAASFIKFSTDVFDTKIDLNGDNINYYVLGKSIASGNGYKNSHTAENLQHNHYPPGYPLIVSGLIKAFSKNMKNVKIANGVFFFLSIVVFFLIIYKSTGNYHIPFITSLFLLTNSTLLRYSTIMMSEMSFIFFSLLCFWILSKIDFNSSLKKNWKFLILVILVSFTYHIRSTGIAIVFAFGLILAYRKQWKYLISLNLGFALLGLPWYLRGKALGGSSYVNQLLLVNPYRSELGKVGVSEIFQRLWVNFERYIAREIPSGTFNFIEVTKYQDPIVLKDWLIGVLLIIPILFGLYKTEKLRTIILFYLFGTFGILLLWPDVWYGTRFLVPIIPFLTFLFINGIVKCIEWMVTKLRKNTNTELVYISLALMSCLSIYSYTDKPINKLQIRAERGYPTKYVNYFKLAQWVRKNTPKNSITACRKDLIFHLFSNKNVARYSSTNDKEQLIENLKRKNVNYVVVDNLGFASTKRYLVPAIKKYPKKFKRVQRLKNPDTFLFEFLPDLGYWGDWKDDKKHGKGIYTWEDGRKYEGEWKLDKMNGKGTLYYGDGKIVEGFWFNNILSGKVTFKSKDGKVLQEMVLKKPLKFKI